MTDSDIVKQLEDTHVPINVDAAKYDSVKSAVSQLKSGELEKNDFFNTMDELFKGQRRPFVEFVAKKLLGVSKEQFEQDFMQPRLRGNRTLKGLEAAKSRIKVALNDGKLDNVLPSERVAPPEPNPDTVPKNAKRVEVDAIGKPNVYVSPAKNGVSEVHNENGEVIGRIMSERQSTMRSRTRRGKGEETVWHNIDSDGKRKESGYSRMDLLRQIVGKHSGDSMTDQPSTQPPAPKAIPEGAKKVTHGDTTLHLSPRKNHKNSVDVFSDDGKNLGFVTKVGSYGRGYSDRSVWKVNGTGFGHASRKEALSALLSEGKG